VVPLNYSPEPASEQRVSSHDVSVIPTQVNQSYQVEEVSDRYVSPFLRANFTPRLRHKCLRHSTAGSERQPAVMNYYVGTDRSRWHSGVPTFAQVRYKNVFSGIDLLFHEKDGGVEFDFEVAPGSDPQQVRLKLDGPYAFSGGDLLVGEHGWMRIQKPRACQILDGHQREVSANYVVKNGELRVGVGEYERSRSLIIASIGPAKNGLEALRVASSNLLSSKRTDAELECQRGTVDSSNARSYFNYSTGIHLGRNAAITWPRSAPER
jgi:hypothetical protein